MMMMDKNSDQIAELIQKWLVSKGCGLTIAVAAQHAAGCALG